jgi:chromosome partitioning protein
MNEHERSTPPQPSAGESQDSSETAPTRVFGGSVDPTAAEASVSSESSASETVTPHGETPSVAGEETSSESVASDDSAEVANAALRDDQSEFESTATAGEDDTEPSETVVEGTVESEAADADDPQEDSAETGDEDDEVVPYDLPRIIAIANQKGGVGKTTTSVNLGASLADLGYRVLVVDLDPQGNATTGLGVNAREIEGSIYDVIMSDTNIEDCIEPTSLKNLFVAPATIDLAGAEIELVPAFSRELKLRRALHEIREDYDYILIDCPPSLGLLTVNGLAAADDVLVPIQCEYYALEGLSQLIRNVTLVRTNLNPTLDVRGIVLTMYDARTKLADQVEQEVRTHFGRTVYLTVIPRTVRLSEAPSFGQPIILFDPTSRGAVAYRELAKEVSSGATRRTG